MGCFGPEGGPFGPDLRDWKSPNVELRRRRLTRARIATSLGVSEATVSRVLRRAGLSKLASLQPVEAVQRYEHAAPGDLLHIDTRKLGVITREGHQIHGDRTKRARGHGWEMPFALTTGSKPRAAELRRAR